MEFNNIWTKELNDELRQMNKEGKSVDEIRKRFGKLLESHPDKKYCSGDKLLPFRNFINEVYVNPKFVKYYTTERESLSFEGKFDYILTFETDKSEYVLILFYLIDNSIESYNILFATTIQYQKYLNKLKEIILTKKPGEKLTENENIELSNILEEQTDLNEPLKIMNSTAYILTRFCPRKNIKLLSIGETRIKAKINMYRDIIKNSFPNITETIGVDEKDKDIYYYSI